MNPFLMQIIQHLQQQKSGMGQEQWGQINPNHYTGQAIQPNNQLGYSMHQYDPQQAMPYQQMQWAFPQQYRTNQS